MNFNRDSSVYNRRRAFMNRSCSGYLKGGITSTSKDSLDDDIDDATSETSSVQSTNSTRSYKSWRQAHKRRRREKLERTQSLFGDATSRDYREERRRQIDPFTFDIRRTPIHSVEGSVDPGLKEDSRNISSSSVDIDIPRHDVTTDNYDVGQFNELSTIIQSPVEPFYSSSSLESLSEGESGKPKISEDDVIRHQKWPTSEEHKETRDWLISKSSPPPQNEYVIKKIPNVIEKSKVPTKRSKEPNLALAFGAGGLNELSRIFEPRQAAEEHSEVFNQISDVNNSVDISIPKVISSTPSYLEQPASNDPTSTVSGTEDGRVEENESDILHGEGNKQPEEQQPNEAAGHVSPVLPNSLHNSNDAYPVFSEELQDFPAEFPNTSVVLPDSAAMLPDTFPVLPDSAAVLPDTFPVLPDSAAVLPDTSPMLQDSPAGLPDTPAVLPDAPQVPPDSPEVLQVASPVLPLSIENPSEKTHGEPLETAEPNEAEVNEAEINEEITHSAKELYLPLKTSDKVQEHSIHSASPSEESSSLVQGSVEMEKNSSHEENDVKATAPAGATLRNRKAIPLSPGTDSRYGLCNCCAVM
ncbi:uncharacterized protein LOC100186872 [Ciona intestinalis]